MHPVWASAQTWMASRTLFMKAVLMSYQSLCTHHAQLPALCLACGIPMGFGVYVILPRTSQAISSCSFSDLVGPSPCQLFLHKSSKFSLQLSSRQSVLTSVLSTQHPPQSRCGGCLRSSWSSFPISTQHSSHIESSSASLSIYLHLFIPTLSTQALIISYLDFHIEFFSQLAYPIVCFPKTQVESSKTLKSPMLCLTLYNRGLQLVFKAHQSLALFFSTVCNRLKGTLLLCDHCFVKSHFIPQH